MKSKSKSIKYILLTLIIISGTLITISMTWQSDPISMLLKQTNDPNLKEKIIIFKKGGYQKSLNYEKHDVEAIINAAKDFIGTPHQMGGLTKKGIDCSGLVMIAHQENEISLPHDGNEQARFGKIMLSVEDLKRGDLVFFHSTYTTDKLVTHSGIYLGDNQFIHVSSKKGASVADITGKYWAEHFLFGTRF
ncbi:MAG: C40 family peptidase [Bacteroidales bacterium]|nr:C40 family peptidase [Bacteroidales bacterium]